MLDTNMVSFLLHQRRTYERIYLRLDKLRFEQRMISAISYAELQLMIQKAANPVPKAAKVSILLMSFNIPDFGQAAAQQYGLIRAHLERNGERIGPMDMLIAAHARSLGAVVVTDNEREFRRVPDLLVENWLH